MIYTVSGYINYEGEELLTASSNLRDAMATVDYEREKRFVIFDKIVVRSWNKGKNVKTVSPFEYDDILHFVDDGSRYIFGALVNRFEA